MGDKLQALKERPGVVITLLSLVVALLGLVVAGLGLALHFSENHETSAVKIIPAASVNSLGSTPAGYAIRISLVNDSLRPVVITAMDLTVGGRTVAPIRTYLPGAFTDAAILGDRPLFEARSLPFSLAARGAETLTGFADFSEAEKDAGEHVEAIDLKLARKFCSEVEPHLPAHADEAEGPARKSKPSVGLKIQSEPGGSEERPWTTSATVSQPTELPNVWALRVLGRRRNPRGIRFWLPTSSPNAFRFITLKVWRRNGKLVAERSEAVAGSSAGRIDFRALGRGRYRAALFRKHGILAIAAFKVPLARGGRIISPSRTAEANGQCLGIQGRGDVFSSQ